jgi:hypothetical protein
MRLIALAGALLTAVASAQPVTEAEFLKVCRMLEDAHRRSVGLAPVEGRAQGGNGPISRAAVAAELAGVFERARSKVRLTPRPYRVDKELIERRNSGKAREHLAMLVRWGLAAPSGPLVAGPGETLDAASAGDLLGYFFSQLSWLTQRPSKRWTPSLMPVEDEG